MKPSLALQGEGLTYSHRDFNTSLSDLTDQSKPKMSKDIENSNSITSIVELEPHTH